MIKTNIKIAENEEVIANNAVIDMNQFNHSITLQISAFIDNVCHINKTAVSHEVDECGTYIKWLNPYGGYSYWLFDDVVEQETKTKSLGFIKKNIENQPESLNTFKHLGYRTEKKYRLESKTPISEEFIDEVETLLSSPEVYLYQSKRFSGVSRWQKIIISEGTRKNVRNKVGVYAFDFSFEIHNVKSQKELWHQ